MCVCIKVVLSEGSSWLYTQLQALFLCSGGGRETRWEGRRRRRRRKRRFDKQALEGEEEGVGGSGGGVPLYCTSGNYRLCLFTSWLGLRFGALRWRWRCTAGSPRAKALR